ncbi:hypothetical protein BDZ45DRAFT_726411 [Acephala macrosclerotiorum]|nr:hypothetical protein BDZ45DRAFT_726411 [Acephala macrosclerotiorum]
MMPPPVQDYDLDEGDQLDPSNFGEYGANDSLQNGPSANNNRPRPSSKPNPDYIPFLERLRRLPPVREIPWRPGQELPPEKAEESPRVQQRGAILLSTRGKVMELKCEHCTRGYGRFSLCVTLDPWFQGACSSCIFTSKGNKCSLRFQTSGSADGRALRYHTENPDALQSYIRSVGDNPPKPTKKRKRRSDAAPTNPPPNTSHSSEPQKNSPVPMSPDLDTLLQAEIAREEDDDQQEYTALVERKPRRQRHSQHARSTPAGPLSTSTWTPTNQTTTEPLPNSSKARDAAPMATSGWAAVNDQKTMTGSSSALANPSTPANGIGMALIDTFPKAKQRQFYGVVSGLSVGIAHLNTQLVTLKELLGIDAEDA